MSTREHWDECPCVFGLRWYVRVVGCRGDPSGQTGELTGKLSMQEGMAVLSGLSGRDSLRGMLARLQPKEEALLLGWGVPMPVRSRRYDEAFWKEMSGGKKSREKSLKELGFSHRLNKLARTK